MGGEIHKALVTPQEKVGFIENETQLNHYSMLLFWEVNNEMGDFILFQPQLKLPPVPIIVTHWLSQSHHTIEGDYVWVVELSENSSFLE